MAPITTKPQVVVEDPEVKFWQECRKRAAELGIPAWKLAEEGYEHPALDKRSRNR
jgi:hypothetical protein